METNPLSRPLFDGIRYKSGKISPDVSRHTESETYDEVTLTSVRVDMSRGFPNVAGCFDTEAKVSEKRTAEMDWVKVEDKDADKNLEIVLRRDESAPTTLFVEVSNPSHEGEAATMLIPFCQLPDFGSVGPKPLTVAQGVSDFQMVRKDDYTQMVFTAKDGRQGALAFDASGFTPDSDFFSDSVAKTFLARAEGNA